MKLSNKMKTELKKRLTSALAILAVLVLVFVCSKNLFVNTSSNISVACVENSDSSANVEVNVLNEANGYCLDITASDGTGVNKIEVFQDSRKIKEMVYSGSDKFEYENMYINPIPFGDSQTITVKVNGDAVDTRTITNTRYIATAQDLVAFRDSVNAGETYSGKIVELTNDIDLSSVCYKVDGTVANDKSWTPIGNSSVAFQGSFDGNFHKIKNIYIKTSGKTNIGLFGFNKRRNKSFNN